MQAPSAAQLVGMWERGARQPWVDRALTLVSACHPELTDSELRALTVGERDADLLALREQIFGRALKSFAECPHCRARLEFSVDVNDLRDSFAGFSNAAPAELTLDDIRDPLPPAQQRRFTSRGSVCRRRRCATGFAATMRGRCAAQRRAARRGRFTAGLRRSAIVPIGGARRRGRHCARSALRCLRSRLAADPRYRQVSLGRAQRFGQKLFK